MSETINDLLQAIYDEHGTLTPELVVSTASDPTHPLHHRLEWDNTKAGANWRLEQASRLIRSARVVYKDDPAAPRDLRAYVAIHGKDTPKADYRPVREVMADPMLREIALRDMEREWKSLKRRYEHMTEFAEMVRRDLSLVG